MIQDFKYIRWFEEIKIEDIQETGEMNFRLIGWILLVAGVLGIIIGAIIRSDWVMWGFMMISVIGVTIINSIGKRGK
jgi:hypothetical protein